MGSSNLGLPYFDCFWVLPISKDTVYREGDYFYIKNMIFSFTRTRHEVSCQGGQDEFSYLYFLLCWIWRSAGLHVMSVLYHASFASNVTHIFAVYYGDWRVGLGLGVGGEGAKIIEQFHPDFNLKSDWKRNLLFRSSSCASTLSQVKKTTLSQVKKKRLVSGGKN